MPLLHVTVPTRAVDNGFWVALATGAVFGVVDAPVAVLIGAAVVIGRRRCR